MRTPNTTCLLCSKPLYRRPGDLARVRYAACMKCRADSQRIAGVTDAQKRGLELGREKGTNHRTGYKHKADSKAKIAAANKAFWESHPDLLNARGEKTRAEKHYRWKGGVSILNKAIRQMTENRRWADAVKDRDGGKCVRCSSSELLESHHLEELAVLIERHGIKSCDDARGIKELWDVANGETLCERCRYAEHGRAYAS